MTPTTFDLTPTSQHADDDGLGVLDEELGLGDGGQAQVAGHVAAQLAIPLSQEAHGHRDGQRHHRSPVIVLYTTDKHTQRGCEKHSAGGNHGKHFYTNTFFLLVNYSVIHLKTFESVTSGIISNPQT